MRAGSETHREAVGWIRRATGLWLLGSLPALASPVFGPDGQVVVILRDISFHARGAPIPPDLYGPFTTNDTSGPLLFVSSPFLLPGEPGTLRLAFSHFNEVRFSMSRDGGYTWPVESRRLQEYEDFAGVENSNLVAIADQWAVMWTERNPATRRWEARVGALDSLGRRKGPSALLAERSPAIDPYIAIPRLARLPAEAALVATWVELLSPLPGQAMSTTSFGDGLAFGEPVLIGPTAALPAGGPVTLALEGEVLAALLAREESLELQLYRAAPGAAWSLAHRFELPEGYEHEGEMNMAAANGVVGLAAVVDPGDPPLQVWFWESADGGATWSDPVEVSASAPAGNHYDAYLAADPLGGWHCAWLRNTPFALDMDVFYARRAPGTTLWSPPARVNRMTGDVGVSVGSSLSIVADQDGHAYIAYQELEEDRTFYLMTTRPRPWDGLDGTSWYVATPVALAGPHARVRFSTPSSATVTATVFDLRGRLVRRWPAREFSRGIHTIEWNGTTADGRPAGSGIYTWRFDYDLGDRVHQATTRSVIVR